MSAHKAKLLNALSNASNLPPDQKYVDGSKYLRGSIHARLLALLRPIWVYIWTSTLGGRWRNMVPKKSAHSRRLLRMEESWRSWLVAVYSQLDLLSSECEAELCAFEDLPLVGDDSAQVNAWKFATGASRRPGRFDKWKLCHCYKYSAKGTSNELS